MGKYFKKLSGKERSEVYRFPSVEETIDRMWKQSKSKYKLRLLGQNETKQVLLSEEERGEHMHIIGTTGEGKSRFLELLIREDIKRGNGLCLLDPSDRGDTVYKVLAYCAKIGHKKVLLIDPVEMSDRGKIVAINPLQGSKEASVSSVRDAIQTAFGQKDQSETPRIQRYLTAILSVLWNAGLTIHEAKYFSDREKFINQRMQILDQSDPFDRHRMALEEVFTTRSMYLNELQSTLRRLEIFQHPIIDLMFSVKEGIKFTDLIAEGWVILVNLYPDEIEQIHGKLLGSIVINEIVSAIDRLRKNGWKGRYYLYIDEAGEYATYKLANLLAYKRKAGLSVIVAHQYFAQFEERKILDAVLNLCKLKVAFNVLNDEDRLKVVRMFYGGALKDRDVSYVLSQIKKQHAAIKLPKIDPMLIKIPNVPDIDVDTKPYLEALYNEDSYKNVSDLINEQQLRFEGQNSVRATRGAEPKRRAIGKASGRKTKHGSKGSQEASGAEVDNTQTDTDRLWDSVFLEDGGGQT